MLEFTDAEGYVRVRYRLTNVEEREYYNVGMLSKYINEWRFHPNGQFGLTSSELIKIVAKLQELNNA